MKIKLDIAKDRKEMLRKAYSWKRRGKGPRSFEAFIRGVWPTGVARVGEKTLKHLIAFVWGL